MLALIAGTGDLPKALVARLAERPLICSLAGFEPDLSADITFRIEHLGSFLEVLSQRGISEICMAGAVRRPPVDPAEIDPATAPLVPQIQKALTSGDDGALRAIMGILESRGFAIRAAHDIAPDLLPNAGVPTQRQPGAAHRRDARVAEQALREMGQADSGQACIVRDAEVLARETLDGTDVMLTRFADDGPDGADPFNGLVDTVSDVLGDVADWLTGPAGQTDPVDRGILFKGPKPQQDRRADLPVIGLETARNVIAADLDGIVLEAAGVMVLDFNTLVQMLDDAEKFLWVRRQGEA